MKLLVIASAFVACSLQIKWDEQTVSYTSRGKLNKKENYWTGNLYQCDYQCTEKSGFVCGQSQRQCCHANSCQVKYGAEVCTKLVKSFQCTPDPASPFRLKDTFPPENFPTLSPLYSGSTV